MESLSLKSLGYTIEPVEGKDEKGNDWVFKVTPPPFYIKATKRGKLKAYRHQTDKVESSIGGLYNFVEQDGDLVGSKPVSKKVAA